MIAESGVVLDTSAQLQPDPTRPASSMGRPNKYNSTVFYRDCSAKSGEAS